MRIMRIMVMMMVMILVIMVMMVVMMTVMTITMINTMTAYLVITPPPQVTRFCLACGITHQDSRVDLEIGLA